MKYEEKFFDRFPQVIDLLKSNFFYLISPFFALNLLYFLFKSIFLNGYYNYFALQIQKFLESIKNISEVTIIQEKFGELLKNNFSEIIQFLSIHFLLFALFIFLMIPVFIMVFKILKETINSKKINFKEVVNFGFSKLSGVFKIYLYLFFYIYFIPAIFLITGLVLILLNIINIGVIFLVLTLILVFPFLIYRGVRTTFSVYNSLEKDDFSKEEFKKNIEITHNNFWRIFGNVILLGLILSALVSFISGTISGFLSPISTFNQFFGDFVVHIFDNIISSTRSVFLIIFIYIFYKRIEFEFFKGNNKQTDKKLEL